MVNCVYKNKCRQYPYGCIFCENNMGSDNYFKPIPMSHTGCGIRVNEHGGKS